MPDTADRIIHIDAEICRDLPGEKQQGDFTYGDSPQEIAADNYRRATFACVGLTAFAQCTGLMTEEPDTAITDLLGDLMHLADCLDLNFDDLLGRAQGHYLPETRGEL